MAGFVLIAGNDTVFIRAVSEQLLAQGFQVENTPDHDGARRFLGQKLVNIMVYDLDLRDSQDLDFVQDLVDIDPAVEIILVASRPDLTSVIDAVNRPVSGFVVKSANPEPIIARIHNIMQHHPLVDAVGAAEARVRSRIEDLQRVKAAISAAPARLGPIAREDFIRLNLLNMAGSLLDLLNVNHDAAPGAEKVPPCSLYHCPRLAGIHETLREAIEICERTKHAFRSKEIAELRKKLENLLSAA